MHRACLFPVALESKEKKNPEKAIQALMNGGVFGVRLPNDFRHSKWQHRDIWYATFADHLTIRPGDKVYFFAERKIFGVGEAVGISSSKDCAAIVNFPDADIFGAVPGKETVVGGSANSSVRIAVLFKPAPRFFADGIDMDEVLSYPGAEFCWGLRFFSGFNVLQLGIQESALLESIFLRRFPTGPRDSDSMTRGCVEAMARADRLKVSRPSIFKMLRHVSHAMDVKGSRILRENAIHGALLETLLFYPKTVPDEFVAAEDYLIGAMRQVAASPPKPNKYADRMDVMRFLGWSADRPVPIKFDIFECKREVVAEVDDDACKQALEYVDFVARNHASGDYGAVRAAVLAKAYSEKVLNCYREAKAMKPPQLDVTFHKPYVLATHGAGASTKIWRNLHLMTYDWNGSDLGLKVVS